MELLYNYKLLYKVNFLIFLKYFVFIFCIWIYRTSNDVFPFGKSLEYIYKQEKILNINIIRLLTKYDIKSELEHSRLREKSTDRRTYKGKRNVYDNVSTYSGLKGKASNNVEIYMKNYKKRYMRKKGLSKFECYCENKVFRKFNNICDIGKKMQYNEKRANKFFLKKYGISLILFALIAALGLIFPIIFGISDKSKGLLDYCLDQKHGTDDASHNSCDKIGLYNYQDIIMQVSYVPLIFSFIMISIVILFIIYILIKIIKYEKLKAGK